ncbi:MAG: hypothetical protein PHS34_09350, partial [Candidatus Omnitrophica bacterium]|nr:hypothetical protein [Candidatus Omnitrophota bacterium]
MIEENVEMVENQTQDNEPMVETPTQNDQPVVETPTQNEQQVNFRTLRAEKERVEKENAEYARKLREYEEVLYNNNKNNKDVQDDMDLDIKDDELFEGRHYKKLQKQLKQQQDILNQYQSQMSLTTTEMKLKSQFNDFDKVVNEENIRKLRETEPELADSISSTPDLYKKAVSAYKAIKKFGIYDDNYQLDKEIINKN